MTETPQDKFEDWYRSDTGKEALGSSRNVEDPYSSGLKDLLRIAFKTGRDEGFNEGYYVGSDEGYDQGVEVGDLKGFDRGYDTGHDEGHNEGYEAGRDEGYEARGEEDAL